MNQEFKVGDKVYYVSYNTAKCGCIDIKFSMILELSIKAIQKPFNNDEKGLFLFLIEKEGNLVFNNVPSNKLYFTEKEALTSYLEKICKDKKNLYDEYVRLHKEEIKIVQKLIKLKDDKL